MSDRIVSADEARRLLSEYDAGYLPDGPERYDLARTVVALHAEVARLRDDPALDGTDGAHPAWWRGHDRAAEVWRERVEAAEREAARLREIIEGRTVPPTDEQMDAIRASGGAVRIQVVRASGGTLRGHVYDHDEVLQFQRVDGIRWWAHDASGRPCAWPVVGGER